MMQDAGADALELNVYFVAADPDQTGRDVESRYLDLVAAVKQSISIPLAVKFGPYFSAMANMGVRMAQAGADGLVLFNRFFQPDIDLDTLEAHPQLHLSSPSELLTPLRWIAILHGRVDASLAASGGIHAAAGLLKALLAGADVGMIASVLYHKGVAETGKILDGVREWMEAERLQLGRAAQGEHELRELPRPLRLPTRQLHEDTDFVRRQGHLACKAATIGRGDVG